MATARLDSHALLAIDPRALAIEFVIPLTRANQRLGASEVVSVEGPLTSKDGGLFDSYESIRDRCRQACMGDAAQVVLRINSPGGEVHDCFTASREIRAMCAAAGKPLTAYIDGTGCSAAYALATAASSIVAAETSTVGSIGVITERQDISEMLAREGIKISYIASGAKKAYGIAETPESDAERMDTQRCIDNLAQMFFALVEQHRGVPASQVAMLEAGTFVGQEAVKVGLVDRVATFESLFIESINAPPSVSGGPAPYEEPVTQEQLLDAIRALIESGDAEGIAAAQALLDAASPEAEEPAPEEKPEDMPEEEPAADASVETAAALATQLETALAENKALKDQLDGEAKAKFFASNQVSDQLRAVLEPKPLSEIEAIVAAMQAKPETKKGLGTVKTLQGAKGISKSPEELALDRAFGLNKDDGPSVSTRGQVQTFRLAGGR